MEVTVPLSPTISLAMAPYVVRLVTTLSGAAGGGEPNRIDMATSECISIAAVLSSGT